MPKPISAATVPAIIIPDLPSTPEPRFLQENGQGLRAAKPQPRARRNSLDGFAFTTHIPTLTEAEYERYREPREGRGTVQNNILNVEPYDYFPIIHRELNESAPVQDVTVDCTPTTELSDRAAQLNHAARVVTAHATLLQGSETYRLGVMKALEHAPIAIHVEKPGAATQPYVIPLAADAHDIHITAQPNATDRQTRAEVTNAIAKAAYADLHRRVDQWAHDGALKTHTAASSTPGASQQHDDTAAARLYARLQMNVDKMQDKWRGRVLQDVDPAKQRDKAASPVTQQPSEQEYVARYRAWRGRTPERRLSEDSSRPDLGEAIERLNVVRYLGDKTMADTLDRRMRDQNSPVPKLKAVLEKYIALRQMESERSFATQIWNNLRHSPSKAAKNAGMSGLEEAVIVRALKNASQYRGLQERLKDAARELYPDYAPLAE